jgi:hypothetical protein
MEMKFRNRCIALSTQLIFGTHLMNVTLLIPNYAHPTSDLEINWNFYHVLYNLHPRNINVARLTGCIIHGKGKGKVHPRAGHEGPEGE